MKKGEQGTAAGLVATIAGLIILYILFLPPADRAELLGETTTTGSRTTGGYPSGSVSSNEESVFRTSPGLIRYQSMDEFEYELPSFTLVRTTEARVLESASSFRVRNGVFDKVSRNVSFRVADVDNTDNAMISFIATRRTGTLTITLNGEEIYNEAIETREPAPLGLPQHLLVQGTNILTWSVSGVGAAFWRTNEYTIQELRIVADVTDVSRQQSKNSFSVSEDEAENLEKADLEFVPECSEVSVGLLEIDLNGRNLFSGVPDCGMLNSIMVPVSYLSVGRNSITFKTSQGSYLIDRITVHTYLKEPVEPTFYFELDDEYFSVKSTEARCGERDGSCPSSCSEDSDWDCCFEENPNGYWCDLQTRYAGDRCISYLDMADAGRCRSGYEDRTGDAPDFDGDESLCGDDTDDECLSGCSATYDKDCCFDKPGDQYWCDELPTTGESFVCVNDLTASTCQFCLDGYEAEEDGFACDSADDTSDTELKRGIDVTLYIRFTESDTTKEATMWINGRQSGFDTRESSVRKNINSFVEEGTNSIKLKPRTDLDIREIEVTVD